MGDGFHEFFMGAGVSLVGQVLDRWSFWRDRPSAVRLVSVIVCASLAAATPLWLSGAAGSVVLAAVLKSIGAAFATRQVVTKPLGRVIGPSLSRPISIRTKGPG